MDAFQHRDTTKQRVRHAEEHSWAAWRRLPRLLVSRHWRWITLIVLMITAVLIRLGVWQLQRLVERRAHNAQVASRMVEPPLALTGAPLDVDALEYRRVSVRGTYEFKDEIVLRTQSRNGIAGVEIVTPLQIGGSEQHVLVNRGWVPLLQYDATALQQYRVPGEVQIEGILRKPQTRTSAIGPLDRRPPDGRLETWFRVDVPQIAEQVQYPLLSMFVEQLPAADAPTLPDVQPDTQLGEGSHLSYAIQWFSFALIALGGYAAFVATRAASKPSANEA